MNLSLKILVLVLLGTLLTCDLPHEPGPMPGNIIDTEFVPGLNILGVLRADNVRGSSQFHIGRALTTEEIYAFDVDYIVNDALVRVIDQSTNIEYLFSHTQDSLEFGIYRDSTFAPIPGHQYDLEISAPGFPTLTATTLIPESPEIVENSLIADQSSVSFQLVSTLNTYEYQIYLICEKSIIEQKITSSGSLNQAVIFELQTEYGLPEFILISANDQYLTSYSNSAISFLPNTYHADGSTVTNGYGVFGSVAITSLEL